jgi:Uncharacterized protein conserved in bacteria
MLLKKLGTAASVVAAIGMVFPMTVGFTSQTGSRTSTVATTHQYRIKANNETAADLENDIQNAKINKYHTLIEMKIQESKQAAAASKTQAAEPEKTVKKAAVRKTVTQAVARPVVKKSVKPVVRTHQSTAEKDESQVKPTVPVKKTATVKPVKTTQDDTDKTPVKTATKTATKTVAKTRTAPVIQQKTPVKKQTVKPVVRQQPTVSESSGTAVQKPVSQTAPSVSGSSATFTLTAYSLKGTTATGVNLTANPNAKVIAVDPNVIPLGSTVTIPGLGSFTAADTGGAIQGHRIDVHMPTTQAALNFGVRSMQVTVNR